MAPLDRLRLGVILMPTDPWPETVSAAQRVEGLGYDHLWVYDHLSWRHYRDRTWWSTYAWLTGIAAATERIRLGPLVGNPNVRHPLLLAKDAMTIDHVSGGRFVLTVGAGGLGFDAEVLGQEPLGPGERIDRLTEHVEVLDGLLRGELEDHEGDWYRIVGARMLPGCVQRPRVPLGIAASGRRGLALVAERADLWVTIGAVTGGEQDLDDVRLALAEQTAMLEDRCSVVGRDPAGIDRLFAAGPALHRPLASLDAVDELLGICREAGVTDLVVHHPRADDPVWDDPPERLAEIAERHL